jgi:hypothetical protein
LTEKLSSSIVEHQHSIAGMSLQLEQDKGNISYLEEKLQVQLQSDKEENFVLLRDKMEAEHLLTRFDILFLYLHEVQKMS